MRERGPLRSAKEYRDRRRLRVCKPMDSFVIYQSDVLTRIPKWGRDGALRRPGRRAQRQATERVGWRVKPGTICSARSARAGTAQLSLPTIFSKGSLRDSGLKINL